MIYEATKVIEAKLKEQNFKYHIDETEKHSIIRAGIGGDNLSYRISFASSDNDADVSVRALELVKVPEAKRAAALEVINDANLRFRFFKFTLDKDGDVNGEFDIPVKTPMSAVGEVAWEMIVRSMDIFDKVYPDLMKAIWS